MILYNPSISGSLVVTGSSISLNGVNVLLTNQTASISVLSSSFALTSSFVLNAVSSSYAVNALTGSNAMTASSADTLYVRNNVTALGSITAQTLIVQTITSSVLFTTGSNIIGSSLSNVQQLTGSVGITGSLSVNTNGTEFQVNAGGVNIGNALTDNHVISGSLRVNPNGLFVSSSGNVGIGTTTPSTKLHIEATSPTRGIIGTIKNATQTGAQVHFVQDSVADWVIGQPANTDAFAFWNNRYPSSDGTERMRIGSDGTKYLGVYNTSRLQINPTGENVYSYTNNYYIWGLFNDSNSLSIESAFAGNIIFRAQAQSTSSSPTTATERMRITSGGSLLMAKDAAIGINTADGTDDGYLALCGASGDGPTRGGHIYLSGNERSADPGHVTISAGNVIGIGSVITFRTAGTERMRLIGNGRLVIGQTADGGYLLYVNGSAAGTSGFANVSDRRLKKDIIPIENALHKIKQLNGISFNWDKTLRPDLNVDDKNHLGLIAQDVEEILPQVVTTSEDEIQTKTITYSDIVPVLIEAIKELKSENDTLKEILQRNNIQ